MFSIFTIREHERNLRNVLLSEKRFIGKNWKPILYPLPYPIPSNVKTAFIMLTGPGTVRRESPLRTRPGVRSGEKQVLFKENIHRG